MNLVYQGKTKDVYEYQDGLYLLKFKDDVTGSEGVFDPGANQVGLTIDGMGLSNLKMSSFFFQRLLEANIESHYVSSDLNEKTMIVHKVKPFGNGLEVICRYRAVGSFIRRYGQYISNEAALDGYVEFTLKDDRRNDPLITKEGLLALGIVNTQQYDRLVALTQQISSLIKDILATKGLELYDIKLEFGTLENGTIVLMDELSAGNMRVYKDGKSIQPLELEKLLLGGE